MSEANGSAESKDPYPLPTQNLSRFNENRAMPSPPV
jgi:hypothetical protein